VSRKYKWIIVLLLWLGHIAFHLSYTGIGALAPFIKSDFGLTSTQVGFLASTVSIGSILTQIPTGFLSDVIGLKIIFFMGVFSIGLSVLAASLSNSYLVLIIALFCLGLGGGFTQSPSSKAVMYWFPLKGRATAMGVKQTGVNAGGMLACFLLPLVATYYSWRCAYVVSGLLCLIIAGFIFFLYREHPSFHRVKIVDSKSIFRNTFKIFSSKDMILITLIGIFFMVSQHSFVTHAILYFTKKLNYSVSFAGAVAALSLGSGAMARIGWGIFSDYLMKGSRKLILIFLSIMSIVSTGAIGLLDPSYPIWFVLLSIILFGFSCIGWNAVWLTTIGELSGKELVGMATGICVTASYVGMMLGPLVFGYIVDSTGSYRFAWMFLVLCSVIVLLMSILLGKQNMEKN